MAQRDTYKYELKQGNRVVYVGTTNNPDSRIDQHLQGGKNFTHMNIIGNVTTGEGAKKWEAERLETYRRNHGGDNPKYNKKRNG